MSVETPSLADWLIAQLRVPATYARFETVDVTEREECGEAHRDHLSGLLRASALDPEFVRDNIELAGWETGESMVAGQPPARPRAKRGRFGEALAVAALAEFDGYVVPVEKARHAVTGGQSQPSTDALALRVDDSGEIVEVCFVEVKLRTTSDNAAPMQGVRQLAQTCEDLPTTQAGPPAFFRPFARGGPGRGNPTMRQRRTHSPAGGFS